MEQSEFKMLTLVREQLDTMMKTFRPAKRKEIMDHIKTRRYTPSLRQVIGSEFPEWDGVSTTSVAKTVETMHNHIRSIRDMMAHRARYKPIEKHLDRSGVAMNLAIREARPSARGATIEMATSTKIDPSMSTLRVALSPGYWKFELKLGISSYKNLVFLNGFLIHTPYEGAELWNCAAYDTTKRETRIMYVGKVDGSFVVHANASYCATVLQKTAAQRALAAMKASMVR